MNRQVPVTPAQVAAAQLGVRIREEKGIPVDPRLRKIANAQRAPGFTPDRVIAALEELDDANWGRPDYSDAIRDALAVVMRIASPPESTVEVGAHEHQWADIHGVEGCTVCRQARHQAGVAVPRSEGEASR